mmetsp:Transcript_96072/g.271956  ORF Transcript_96072/g.271956 Transcript_96072/m.271956 type:complete len:178 (+) Transcript_96072:83-616(+)
MAARSMMFSLVVALVSRTGESSDWVVKKCQGQTCADPDYPMIDWDGERCICRQHPCWNDDGKQHSCGEERPYLAFGHMKDGTLVCSCRKFPHIGSVYIGRELCPGEACESEAAPILEYDDKQKKCACAAHPCMNDNGLEHQCKNPEFPLLTYTRKEDGALQCGCGKKLNPPAGGKEL